MNFNDVGIVSIKGSDYRIHFWYMSKDDAINIMKNSNLNEKSGFIKKKSVRTNSYQRNREKLLRRAKEYHENKKERLQEQAKNKYRELSNEEKDIKREYI